ncbi:MAG: amidohydrolase/deacetylase family metallohydrolase [Thermomicrobium sp.]|nr:amidohydrolase/deacetylase family metallohydrolase [Thermomicrobium sp.]MDW8006887.1 amidohydrolase/deacetylase family metallohydrolase [Thermomicrobium sp.]
MSRAAERERFDTLILGGELVDPGTGRFGRFDIGIRDGVIARVAPSLADAVAEQVIDARGQLVTPGLVDLHTHVYWGATYWGIEPDPIAARTGVTTWLDAGSAGAYTFPGLRRYIIERSRVRIFALLNLSSIGLVAPTWEFANLDYCDVDLAARVVEANRDRILGVKARIDANTTRGVGIRPLQLARQLADSLHLPLMVHINNGPPTLEEVAALLRPGDILTHCSTGGTMRIITPDGKVQPAIRALREQGLVLDIGHGTGSFSFAVAEALLAEGIVPDTISSDIHQLAVQGPMFDLPTTLSKFLALGLSLPDVIERATVRPAQLIGRPELGSLAEGTPADIALFRLVEGDVVFYDVMMEERRGSQLLVNTLTMVSGRIMPRTEPSPLQLWAELPEHQRGILAIGHPYARLVSQVRGG